MNQSILVSMLNHQAKTSILTGLSRFLPFPSCINSIDLCHTFHSCIYANKRSSLTTTTTTTTTTKHNMSTSSNTEKLEGGGTDGVYYAGDTKVIDAVAGSTIRQSHLCCGFCCDVRKILFIPFVRGVPLRI